MVIDPGAEIHWRAVYGRGAGGAVGVGIGGGKCP